MSELEDSNASVRPDEAHERWLAMQSAYAEYMRASEVFANGQGLTRDSADLERCDLTLLDSRRDAFERYLEARIEYLERRYDEDYRRQAAMASPPTRETGRLKTVSRLLNPKWHLIPVLVVGLLSVTVVSFVREQKHVRELDSARDELRASLSGTREELQLLVKKLDALRSTEGSGVRHVEHTAKALAPVSQPAPTPQVVGRKPSGGTRWPPSPERIMKLTSRNIAARGYFSIARSPQYKRVGPIKLSLRSVDMRRNCVDISIVSHSGKLNVQHLRLKQPVQIKPGYHGQPMELVVDRITANGLSGHLIEFHG